MNIASWNVNSLRVRLPHVLGWLTHHSVDVLCLQEIKMTTDLFPHSDFQNIGYESCVSGQKTYNGVAIVSRFPISDVVTDIMNFPDEQRRLISATICGVRVHCVYVPNGESTQSDKYLYKLAWLDALNRHIQVDQKQFDRMVIAGDFNIAPDDRDVHDPVLWRDSVLCSDPERKSFQGLLSLGLHDCFREKHGDASQFTWWDYRLNAFKRNRGLRIDHILCSSSLLSGLSHIEIDRRPRELDRPSDHAPIHACFQ